jgi:hypothetical protein
LAAADQGRLIVILAEFPFPQGREGHSLILFRR